MKLKTAKYLLAAILLASAAGISAAGYECLPTDSATAVRILERAVTGNRTGMGAQIRKTAEGFVGAPYRGGTLEGEPEMLRINLAEFDCTTFVESILALCRTAAEGGTEFGQFASTLASIRYMDGESDRYTKRLHYFSQWIRQNAAQGVIEEIIPADIAVCETKKIDFMSMHANLYPALGEKSLTDEIARTEEMLSRDTVCFIPKEKIPQLKKGDIRDGDIIAIVTAKKGLDITHVGFAAILDGEPHLLHASSAAGKVILDPRTMHEYLMHYTSHRGVRILRPTEPQK